MVRQLPAGFALVIRNGLSPVIARLARGWEYRPYRRLRRRGLDIAAITAPAMLIAGPPAVPAAVPDDGTVVLRPARAPEPAQPGNGNGHRGGSHPWSER